MDVYVLSGRQKQAGIEGVVAGASCCVQPAWINRSIQADT